MCDAMARGGGAEAVARVRAEARSGPSSSERAQDDLLDAAARSQRAGRSNDVLDLLAASSRVSEETWHGLGYSGETVMATELSLTPVAACVYTAWRGTSLTSVKMNQTNKKQTKKQESRNVL